MKKEKFESFLEKDRKEVGKKMSVKDIKIKDPDNPKKYLKAKLISFSF